MRKILPLVMLVSTACGDTNNHYYTNGSEGSGSISSCEMLVDKYFACGLNEPDSDYNRLVDKCKNKGWLNTEWKSCFEANSCEDLTSGVCDQYANL